MQEKEYVALVEKLEAYSREHPSTYRLRVALFAALGYLPLFGVVGIVLLLVLGVIYIGKINFLVIKILIIPLGLAAVVLRSLWIEFPEPEGIELKPDDAPKLFALTKEIRKATNGPRVHKVLLTTDYNAGVVQRPRLGVFGWQRNYLVVGLPLLQALSPNDFRAVLAHEFGHLSGNHGRFSGWIYRVRTTREQDLAHLQENRRYGSGIFETFFNWYSPYFGAYSFVLARSQEYEADRCSVEVAGRENAARALINLELKEKTLSENFWPELFKSADNHADPPRDTFTQMLTSLRQPISPDKAQLWFVQSLNTRHEYYDTHPSLVERLEAMGYEQLREHADLSGFVPGEVEQSSADYFLSMPTNDFIRSQDRLWIEQVSQGWQERHQFVNEARNRLVELEEKLKSQPLTGDELWERARLTVGTEGYNAATPLLREVLETDPDHVAANYMYGEAMLEAGDAIGIKHIETAIKQDLSGIPAGCGLIYSFLKARNEDEEAERYRQCIFDHYAEVDSANLERTNISKKDTFVEHGLEDEILENLKADLAKCPNLGKAYLVRKVVTYFPDQPSFVLGVTSKIAWYQSQSNKRDQALLDQLASQVQFPRDTYMIALEHNYKPLLKVFKKVEGSLIYQG